jgi:hypothetical protein
VFLGQSWGDLAPCQFFEGIVALIWYESRACRKVETTYYTQIHKSHLAGMVIRLKVQVR